MNYLRSTKVVMAFLLLIISIILVTLGEVEGSAYLFIASLIVSLASLLYGIFQLINNEYLLGVAFLFGGISLGWNDWISLFKKNK